MNDALTWHDKKMWAEALSMLAGVFSRRNGDVHEIRDLALSLRRKIDAVDGFIQANTAQVCPGCRKVCCINKHGYYDHQDLIYISALGLKPPPYREGISDTDPCQFLSEYGCTIDRSIRPFRCNWHFCNELIDHMNAGPAKPLREFNLQFRELQALRQEMTDHFFRVL
ncbi:MAG TPA: hypothetical protein VMB78_10190 [Dissulfurispiraceae bacterium]|nr:hypothetical protein [Dissulfurispiraceae bacterium]